MQKNEELDLQEQQMYQNMVSDYYNQQSNLNSLNSQMQNTQLGINQEKANIASNNDFLSRYQSYADTTLSNQMLEGKSNYSQLASNWASGESVNSDAGRTGGSASLLNNMSKQSVRDYVGDSYMLNTSSGLFGQNYQQTAIDLTTQKANTINAISSSNEAIGTYNETINSLSDSIVKQQNTINNTSKKLDSVYGEGNW